MAFRAVELPRSVAFQFRDDSSGATALFAPSVGELTNELRNAVDKSDVVLFDGTFWSNGELGAIRPGARGAREMNHLPISDGSLDFLHHAPARWKIYKFQIRSKLFIRVRNETLSAAVRIYYPDCSPLGIDG
jgi:hypothetical protein